jgi:ELWxxDGT repeat protein
VRVSDIYSGTFNSNPEHLTNGGGFVFFSADDGMSGKELWQSNGTEAGTRQVGDIYPGSGSASPESIAYAGRLLFFSADDGSRGRELWALSFYRIYLPLLLKGY